MKKHDIYGPDLSEHEAEAAQIAAKGLKSMKGHRATDEAEESEGPTASKNGLEQLHPSKP